MVSLREKQKRYAVDNKAYLDWEALARAVICDDQRVHRFQIRYDLPCDSVSQSLASTWRESSEDTNF